MKGKYTRQMEESLTGVKFSFGGWRIGVRGECTADAVRLPGGMLRRGVVPEPLEECTLEGEGVEKGAPLSGTSQKVDRLPEKGECAGVVPGIDGDTRPKETDPPPLTFGTRG